MRNSVQNKTTKHNLCIGCGICKIICPSNAIELKPNKYKELNPNIASQKCTDCGLCISFCPHTKEKIQAEAAKISSSSEPQAFGLENAKYYLAWNSNDLERVKSASGGAITKLSEYLLANTLVDSVVHVERIAGKRGEPHYVSCISESIEEIKNRASSAYQPIDFSNVLDKLEQNKTYFITGTPCVIRAFKKLFSEHKLFKNINIITCALICSHNTNTQFMDYLADLNKLPNDTPYYINIRNKDNLTDANNFNNHFYTDNDDLLKMNRFETGWTDIWRSYYFAMGCCNYCSDFWGYEADISVKDAWGEWASDPLGKSIVVVRNNKADEIFQKCGLDIEDLDYDTMKYHQGPTSEFKQKEAKNRNFKSFISRSNRKNGMFKYLVISKASKFLYKNFGFTATKKLMKIIEKIVAKGSNI